MALRKKQSEAMVRLVSNYNDEKEEHECRKQSEDASMLDVDGMAVGDSTHGDSAQPNAGDNENSTPSRRGTLTIVDNGHDEVAKCSEELQRKINKFLELKRCGKSFNAGLRNKKEYRNPDFLLHAVRYLEIDEIGSCFSKDVFDPHGFDKSDYIDEIEADMRREMDRKEQERKTSQKIEYVLGRTHPGIVGGAIPKINVPFPGVSALAATGLK